jgi:hypothetical protein
MGMGEPCDAEPEVTACEACVSVNPLSRLTIMFAMLVRRPSSIVAVKSSQQTNGVAKPIEFRISQVEGL